MFDFLEERYECTKRAAGTKNEKQSIIRKLTPNLKWSINFAYLKNGTYDQIVAHLKREFKLGGLETDRELPIPTLSTTKTVNKQNQPKSQKISNYSSELLKRSFDNPDDLFLLRVPVKIEQKFCSHETSPKLILWKRRLQFEQGHRKQVSWTPVFLAAVW